MTTGTSAGPAPAGNPLIRDFLASLVVFLVALPLSLGIAVASGVPVLSGLVAAVAGGILAGLLAGAPLQVSGPAAGLTVLVFGFASVYGPALTAGAVVVAGLVQLLMARLGVARAATAISPAVVHGMLAGIGVLIVLSQLHVLLGGTPEPSGYRNLVELPGQIADLHGPATMIGLFTLALLVAWQFVPGRLRVIPGALVAVAAGSGLAVALGLDVPRVELASDVLAALTGPALPTTAQLGAFVTFALTVAFVASAESLLCAVATDQLHEGPRADLDRELLAQGAANIGSGLLGGLPVTGVIVRSSANVAAGARTRRSAILHGVWIGVFALCFGAVIRAVPMAVLAALLVYVGARLVSAHHMRELHKHGELAIYGITMVGVVAWSLLGGIALGVAAALVRLLWRLAHVRVEVTPDHEGGHVVVVSGSLTFLGVPRLGRALAALPAGSNVEIDLLTDYIDHAGLEAIERWRLAHERQGGVVHVEAHAHGQSSAPDEDPVARLWRGVRRFRHHAHARYDELFRSLAAGQSPHTLFITCSDSRIVPNLVTSTDPGELFLVRNVGNLVPGSDGDATPAEGAAIEYAIGVLGVSEIVVCGHSGCGAMKAVREGVPPELPQLARWLGSAADTAALRRCESDDEAAKRNVLIQLERLRAHPALVAKLAADEVRLHGWFYDVGTGELQVHRPEEGGFGPIQSAPSYSPSRTEAMTQRVEALPV